MWRHLGLSRCPRKVFPQLHHKYQLADSNYETPLTERCVSTSESQGGNVCILESMKEGRENRALEVTSCLRGHSQGSWDVNSGDPGQAPALLTTSLQPPLSPWTWPGWRINSDTSHISPCGQNPPWLQQAGLASPEVTRGLVIHGQCPFLVGLRG